MGNMFSKSPNTISLSYLRKKSDAPMTPQIPAQSGGSTPVPLNGSDPQSDAGGAESALQHAIASITEQENTMKNLMGAMAKTRSNLQTQLEALRKMNKISPQIPNQAQISLPTA